MNTLEIEYVCIRSGPKDNVILIIDEQKKPSTICKGCQEKIDDFSTVKMEASTIA